jgi:hypothetical protein
MQRITDARPARTAADCCWSAFIGMRFSAHPAGDEGRTERETQRTRKRTCRGGIADARPASRRLDAFPQYDLAPPSRQAFGISFKASIKALGSRQLLSIACWRRRGCRRTRAQNSSNMWRKRPRVIMATVKSVLDNSSLEFRTIASFAKLWESSAETRSFTTRPSFTVTSGTGCSHSGGERLISASSRPFRVRSAPSSCWSIS